MTLKDNMAIVSVRHMCVENLFSPIHIFEKKNALYS